MANPYLVTGLDVGTTKVCAIIAEVGKDTSPHVIGVGISPCEGLKRGSVVDLDATTAAIRDAVGKAERMAGEQSGPVVLGVTGEHIACMNNRSAVAINSPGREISAGDVERLLDAARVVVVPPDREILHCIPRWFSVDGQRGIRSPIGMHGNRLEVETHIVTGLSSTVHNVVKCVEQAGLAVESVVLEPIATGESVLRPMEKELGVALVDIGGGTSDVAVYVDGQVYYSGVVPIGGNHLTKDIAIGLRTAVDEAERVKLAHGFTVAKPEADGEVFEVSSLGNDKTRYLPGRILVEIIEPRMAEICQFVMDHLEKSGHADRLPGGLVLSGGGSLVRGFPDLASEMTGLPARIGVPSGVTGLIEAINTPAYATAVGLVLYWARNEAKFAEEHGKAGGLLQTVLAHVKYAFKYCQELMRLK